MHLIRAAVLSTSACAWGIVGSGWLFLLVPLPHSADALSCPHTSVSRPLRQAIRNRRCPFLHFAVPPSSDEVDKDDNASWSPHTPGQPPKTINRAGGRIRRKREPLDQTKNNRTSSQILRYSVPFLLLLLIVKTLLGGFGADDSVYFYQSSYVESRVVRSDGKIDTSRKESIRTNIPSMKDVSPQTLREYNARFDEDFDREIEQEMARMLRFQRSTLNDFF